MAGWWQSHFHIELRAVLEQQRCDCMCVLIYIHTYFVYNRIFKFKNLKWLLSVLTHLPTIYLIFNKLTTGAAYTCCGWACMHIYSFPIAWPSSAPSLSPVPCLPHCLWLKESLNDWGWPFLPPPPFLSTIPLSSHVDRPVLHACSQVLTLSQSVRHGVFDTKGGTVFYVPCFLCNSVLWVWPRPSPLVSVSVVLLRELRGLSEQSSPQLQLACNPPSSRCLTWTLCSVPAGVWDPSEPRLLWE